MTLELDGAVLDMDGREFVYALPAPFGPDRGPAVLKIKARPAASMNRPFRAAFDQITQRARVKDIIADKRYAKNNDADQLASAQAEAAIWTGQAIAELNYDHCVIEWSTTIQNKGSDMPATRENFVDLAQFEHPEIRRVFSKMQDDLSDFDKFSVDAETEVQEDEIKN